MGRRVPGFLRFVRPRHRRHAVPVVVLLVLAALVGLMATAGMFDRDAIHLFPPQGRRLGVSAIYFSGDMGLRHGLGPVTSRMLSVKGVNVVGVNMPTLFNRHRTLAETSAIVANTVRETLAHDGSDRLVVIGQSFGADILQTGLSRLPPELRRHIAAVILVVPGEYVFLRADPTGLLYHGTPDSLGHETIARLDWAPLTCIYGVDEKDSLCPRIHLANAHVQAMAGGHMLDHDGRGLTANVFAAIERAVPDIGLRK